MQAAEALWKKFPGCIVIDPTRWDLAETNANSSEEKERISQHRSHSIGEKNEDIYPVQVVWEQEYMNLAANPSSRGMLIFWLPRQVQERKKGVYGQDTRTEVGMFIERLKWRPNLKVLISGDWNIDESGHETDMSFGGMNFFAYYLTGEADRRKIYKGEVGNQNFVRAESVEALVELINHESIEPKREFKESQSPK